MTSRGRSRLYLAGALVLSLGSCKKGDGSSSASAPHPPGPASGTAGAAGGGTQSSTGTNGNGSGPGSGVTISGTLALSLPSGANAPSTVVAFPTSGGSFSASSLGSLQQAPVAANGTIALTVASGGAGLSLLDGTGTGTGNCGNSGNNGQGTGSDQSGEGGSCQGGGGSGSSDLVVAVYDADASLNKFQQGESMRFVSVKADTGAAAPSLNLPAPVAGSNLQFGNIPVSGDPAAGDDEAPAAGTLDGSDFGVSTSVLSELAAVDKPVKALKNAFMNTDLNKGIALLPTPAYAWGVDTKYVIGQQNDLTHESYNGFTINISGQHPSLTLETLCSGSSSFQTLTLMPPKDPATGQTAVLCTRPFGPPYTSCLNTYANGLSNSDASAVTQETQSRQGCGSPNSGNHGNAFGVQIDTSGQAPTVYLGWGGGPGFSGQVPVGFWKLMLGSDQIGEFDLGDSYPFRDSLPLAFFPAINVTVDPTTQKLTKIDIAFFLPQSVQNGQITYQQMTDLTALSSVVKGLMLQLSYLPLNGTATQQMLPLTLPASGATISMTPADLAGYQGNQINNAAPDTNWLVCDSDTVNAGHPVVACPGGSPTKTADSIMISYSMYGNQYFFDHRFQFPP